MFFSMVIKTCRSKDGKDTDRKHCFHAAMGTDRYRIRIRVDPI